MNLTGTLVAVLAVVLAIVTPALTVLLWNKLGRRRAVRTAARVGLLLTCQLTIVTLLGIALNNTFGFYNSWGELLGSSGPRVTQVQQPTGALDKSLSARTAKAFRAGHGTLVDWSIPGTASGLPTQHALVYLPAAYGNPAAPSTRFPVVELLPGFPGHPESWTQHLALQQTLDHLISTGYSTPLIAVMPQQNVAAPRDTQGVNVVGGPQVDTYLTTDVQHATSAAFRTAPGRDGWAMMGYSTGGYSALNLTLRHSDTYAAGVSLSGYARPAQDSSTGDLFGGNPTLRDQNTPLWRVKHLPPAPLAVLLITTKTDAQSYKDTIGMKAAARPPTQLSTMILDSGGHNFTVWTAMEPTAFGWLSRHLTAAVAPLPALVGQVPGP